MKAYMKRYKGDTDPFETQESLESIEDRRHGLSFHAFVSFLMSKDKAKLHNWFNVHWKSIFSTCSPCSGLRFQSLLAKLAAFSVITYHKAGFSSLTLETL